MRKVTDKEFEAVLRLPAYERYGYFVRNVADWEVLWSLKTSDGWVLVGDEDGRECFAYWCHPRFAEACAAGPWSGAEPRVIMLSDWFERWVPQMREQDKGVVVFPTPAGKGMIVPLELLVRDLQEEVAQYEDTD